MADSPAPVRTIGNARATFREWIAELERLRGKPLQEDHEEYRPIYAAGELPQTVIDEWGIEPTVH
jgi:hypothetical protein